VKNAIACLRPGAALLACAIVCGGLSSCSKPARDASAPGASASAVTKASAKPDSSCDTCRARMCSGDAQQVENLAAGCLKTPDSKLVSNPDPNFIRDCTAAVTCAYQHDCGYDAAKGPVHCYCGSRGLDECIKDGPAADAPCVPEWKAATRGKTHMEILERFSETAYPSGWAFALIECDRDRCGARSEVGRCTP
jgi:hypothetical protein